MLNTVKELVQTKGLDKNAFATMLFGLFQSTNYMALTVPQGNVLIASLSALPERPAPQPNGNPS
jgi:hypothetical protein